MDLQNANVVVIMFVLQSCPHCHEFYPSFVKAARKYVDCFPTWILDANDPKCQELADRYQVSATPTILVLKKPSGVLKIEGVIEKPEIEQLFAMAAAHNGCAPR